MYSKKYSHNNFTAELVRKEKKIFMFLTQKHVNDAANRWKNKPYIFHELDVKLILKRCEGATQLNRVRKRRCVSFVESVCVLRCEPNLKSVQRIRALREQRQFPQVFNKSREIFEREEKLIVYRAQRKIFKERTVAVWCVKTRMSLLNNILASKNENTCFIFHYRLYARVRAKAKNKTSLAIL